MNIWLGEKMLLGFLRSIMDENLTNLPVLPAHRFLSGSRASTLVGILGDSSFFLVGGFIPPNEF